MSVDTLPILDRRLLTTDQVAEILNVRRLKVCQLIEAGRLRGIDISNGDGKKPRWRIPSDSVEAFMGGEDQPKPEKKKTAPRRQRIDAGVPKVFG